MNVRLKNIRDQVIVLTGASSGIGLVTARMAARQGARLVLAARSGEELQRLADEITSQGGQAVAVAADVGRGEDVHRIADAARQHFGGFDTWVNDAGVSIYGRLDEVSQEDHRRLFETNFWGVVHGSLVAVRELRQHGGALINIGSVASDRALPLQGLINIGSVASDRALPLQGMYSASKFAVKGFTEALRMELEEAGAPVVVTLIKPGAIATPFNRHAKNYMAVEPNLPPPVYAPEQVARAIIHCAQHPEREVVVGGGGKFISLSGQYAPRLTDKWMEQTMTRQQQTDWPVRGDGEGSLHRPSHDLAERGEYPRHVFERSAYTAARLHPLLSGAAVLGTGLALGAVWSALGKSGRSHAG